MEKNQGSILILSLVILVVVLGTSVAFATISLSNYKQSISIDDAILSYYLAEVGVERGAYYFREHEANPGNCGIVGSCSLDIEAEDKGFFPQIIKDDSVQMDIYSPGSPGFDNITKIVPQWQDGNPGIPIPHLEVSFVGWDNDTYSDPYKVNIISGTTVNLADGCATCDLFRIRFKAIFDDIKDLEIEAQNTFNEPQNIPGVFEIKATGIYGRSQQAVAIITSHLQPLSGLYDYVIFTEEDLEKTYCGDNSVQGSEECDDGSQCTDGSDCTAEGNIACQIEDPDNPGEWINKPGTDGTCYPRSGDGCSDSCEVEP